jgi:hypothetical protein
MRTPFQERIREIADAMLSNSCPAWRLASESVCGQANLSGQATGPPRQYNDCLRVVQID